MSATSDTSRSMVDRWGCFMAAVGPQTTPSTASEPSLEEAIRIRLRGHTVHDCAFPVGRCRVGGSHMEQYSRVSMLLAVSLFAVSCGGSANAEVGFVGPGGSGGSA